MTDEIWKDVLEYPGYMVSNLGQVRGRRGWIMKPYTTRDGYKTVCVYISKTEFKTVKVSRLIATAFLPNPENKPCVDHINRDPGDNRVENLRWVTQSENQFNRTVCFGETRGICWDAGHKAYKISIVQAGKTINYGRRKTLEEAIQFRNEILK